MATLIASPWSIDAADFPATGPIHEQLEFAVGYAVLAPSVHNTQPWRFRVRGDAVELRADRTRALVDLDPCGRELVISCGAALFHLRLALRRFGLRDEAAVFPDAGDPELIAIVRVAGEHEASAEELRLFESITRRRTHRGDFAARAVPVEVVSGLRAAAAAEGAWLTQAEERATRMAISGLTRLGDQVQFADPGFRAELAAWIRSNAGGEPDGMPGYAFGIEDVVSPFNREAPAGLGLGAVWGARSRQAVENAPVLAVLGTDHNGRPSWVAAGQALARVLLEARAAGVYASFLNQPCEVPLLRLSLGKLLKTDGWPQMLLRLGYPLGDPRPTPRRGPEAVLEA
jgi:hypothetical protein